MGLLKDVKTHGKWFLVLSENLCQTKSIREFNPSITECYHRIQPILQPIVIWEFSPNSTYQRTLSEISLQTWFKRPVSVPRWGLLDSPGNFPNFSGVRPSSKFCTEEIRKPTGETTKRTGDDMKVQRGELINMLIWLKNIYTWFNQKHIKLRNI